MSPLNKILSKLSGCPSTTPKWSAKEGAYLPASENQLVMKGSVLHLSDSVSHRRLSSLTPFHLLDTPHQRWLCVSESGNIILQKWNGKVALSIPLFYVESVSTHQVSGYKNAFKLVLRENYRQLIKERAIQENPQDKSKRTKVPRQTIVLAAWTTEQRHAWITSLKNMLFEARMKRVMGTSFLDFAGEKPHLRSES